MITNDQPAMALSSVYNKTTEHI